MEIGDLAEVDDRIEEMGALVEHTGLPYCRWQLLMTRAWRALLAGDLSTGERLNDEALTVASDIGVPEAIGAYGAVLFHSLLLQGRTDELIEPFAQTASENPAIVLLRVILASAYCALERLDEAAVLFEHDAATAFTEFPRDVTWTTAMVYAQEIATALKHREAASTLYELLTPYGAMTIFNYGVCSGALARSLGRLGHLLGRLDAAEAHFGTALSIHQRLDAPYWTARTQLDLADLLRDVGRTDEATGFVDQSLETARRLGFAALESRASTFSA